MTGGDVTLKDTRPDLLQSALDILGQNDKGFFLVIESDDLHLPLGKSQLTQQRTVLHLELTGLHSHIGPDKLEVRVCQAQRANHNKGQTRTQELHIANSTFRRHLILHAFGDLRQR